jgi:hypothetical protein
MSLPWVDLGVNRPTWLVVVAVVGFIAWQAFMLYMDAHIAENDDSPLWRSLSSWSFWIRVLALVAAAVGGLMHLATN